jgi:hypothetical protein
MGFTKKWKAMRREDRWVLFECCAPTEWRNNTEKVLVANY